MHLDNLIVDLSIILIVASVATLLMKKLKQPVVLGYIVAGFLISPHIHFLPSIISTEDITSWAEIGIVFLMFALGLEFSFKKIASVGGCAVITAITVMGFMTIVGIGVGQLMGWGKMDCIFLGGMLSMSSTMIILKAYEEYGLKKENFAQRVLGTLVIEDIGGIFMMIILSTISVSKNVSGVALTSKIGILLIMLVVWFVVGIYLIPSILKKIDKLLNKELLLIVSLAICMGMVMIANFIGFSSALGAFMAGSILAGTVKGSLIEKMVTPIKDLFGAVFFVSVGMLIVPEKLVEYIIPIIILSAVTIVGQMLFSTLGMIFSGQSLRTAIKVGFSMVQIGEFSFIVATLGMSLGVISDFLYPIIVCVSVITSFTTPIFIKNSDKAYVFIEKRLPKKLKAFIRRNNSDNQTVLDKDDDWKIYLKRAGVRTFICSAAMFAAYWLGIKYIGPGLGNYMEQFNANVIAAMIVIIMMVPFIALMHSTKGVLFTKLWLKHRTNRLPLLTLTFLRILIAAAFIALTLNDFFHLPFVIVMIIALLPAYLIVKSDYVRGKTKAIEMSFIANFYEKTLAQRKREKGIRGEHHWMDESIRVARFEIIENVEDLDVKDIGRNPHVHIGIIKVIRGQEYYNMPSGTFKLEKGDVIYALGTKEELEASLLMLEQLHYIQEMDYPKETLKDFIYSQTFKKIPPDKQLIAVPILVREDSNIVNKSIKNSGIREKYKGSIIGIERDNLLITHPSIATVIQPGDLLWLIGGKQMGDKLLKDNLLRSA